MQKMYTNVMKESKQTDCYSQTTDSNSSLID